MKDGSRKHNYNLRKRKPAFATLGKICKDEVKIKKPAHTYNLRNKSPKKQEHEPTYNLRNKSPKKQEQKQEHTYNLRSKRNNINLSSSIQKESIKLNNKKNILKIVPSIQKPKSKRNIVKVVHVIQKEEVINNPINRNKRYKFRNRNPIKYTKEKEKEDENENYDKVIAPSTSNKRKRIEEQIVEVEEDELDEEVIFGWSDFNMYRPATDYNNQGVDDKREWVSATGVKNYLLKDPLLDWLQTYYLEKGFNDTLPEQQQISLQNMNTFAAARNLKKNTFESEKNKLNVFFEMGNKFEDMVVSDLRKRFPNQIKKVADKTISPDLNNVTFRYMMEGIPIIEQAALYNFENRSYGIADLLIRSDWFDKIFQDETLLPEEKHYKAPNLTGNYHYRVIDIKWTTMYLCANGKTLRNSHRFPAYKGQLAIYNAALGLLQGYTPDKAYIMSKAWNLNGKEHGYNCYQLLGHIDYDGFDSKYLQDTSDAIQWVRNVRYNGGKWSCNNPTVPELYPNMCNKFDSPYGSVKKELANELNEITSVWMVGVKHRKIAHEKGIMSWEDPKCNALAMGIKGQKIGPIIDKIIQINRDNIGNISPNIIGNNLGNWQNKSPLDFYLDFEGLTGCIYDRNIDLVDSELDSQSVFMVGVGYENNGIWEYKTFVANSVSREEELRIIREFINFIETRVRNLNVRGRPRFFHWSPAEKSMFNMLNKRYNDEFLGWTNSVGWVDMCKVFTSEPIVLKGSMKFNLKAVAKAMVNHGMIQSKWDFNGPDNGMSAMLEAIDYYRYMECQNKNPIDDEIYRKMMLSIIDYNEIDCKVVWEIVRYLRRNHTKK